MQPLTLFLCGDVMPGRGIDQALPYPCDPVLYEPYVRDARHYLALAERAHGPIPRPVDFAYIWGEALDELRRRRPDLRIVNLETSITRSPDYWPGKEIHYRMSPENAACLAAAGIHCCALANNHVLDWGYAGLAETLATLERLGIAAAGAGRNAAEARRPAVLDLGGKGRVLVFSFGSPTSGIPASWAATANAAGINLLDDLSQGTQRRIAEDVHRVKRPGDLVVASIHWGGNWGYTITREERAFAHALLDAAGVDVVHGHSSHHPKAIEVYRGRPILYGCGDFIDDYEGIGGYEAFRSDLVLMYFVTMEPRARRLVSLSMVPLRIRRLRLERAAPQEARWLAETLTRVGEDFGTRVRCTEDNSLILDLS